TSAPNPSVFGQSATFTATVLPVAPGAGTRTGSVTFFDGGVSMGSAALSAAGTASVSTAALAGGIHSITATYSRDTNFTGNTSAAWQHTVSPAGSSTTLVSSPNPSTQGQSVTFTATVTSTAGVPTGSVNFLDGATVLGSAALSSGAATFSTSALSAGSHSITAAYGGAPNYLPSTSAVLTQTVNPGFYPFTGFLSPRAAAGTLASPSFSGSVNYGSAIPIKWTLKDGNGNFISDLTSTASLQAVAYPAGVCSGQATGAVFVLYTPTTGAKGGSTFRYDSG